MNARILLLCLLGGACATTPTTSASRAGAELSGLVLELVPGTSRRLEVQGFVGRNAARVLLDVARPLTLVAEGCLAGVDVADSGARVEVPRASGGKDVHPELSLRDLRVGGRRLAARKVGVLEGARDCRVWLGSDVLSPYALEIDPALRQVVLVPSRPPEAYPLMTPEAHEEVGLVALSSEPRTDAPLVTARLQLGTVGFAGTFVLATAQDDSRLLLPPGALEAATELGEGEHLSPEQLELAPGLGLTQVPLRVVEGAGEAVLGSLGADVWGRFRSILDVRARTLRLSRPRAASGPCDGPACVEARVLARRTGAEGSVVLWGRLPEGGVVHLEARGSPESAGPCELELSLPPSGAGESLAFPLAGPEAPGGGCGAGASTLAVTRIAPARSGGSEGVCIASAGAGSDAAGRRTCRPGSAQGRRAPAPEQDAPSGGEELQEPEDPPPTPPRPRGQPRRSPETGGPSRGAPAPAPAAPGPKR